MEINENKLINLPKEILNMMEKEDIIKKNQNIQNIQNLQAKELSKDIKISNVKKLEIKPEIKIPEIYENIETVNNKIIETKSSILKNVFKFLNLPINFISILIFIILIPIVLLYSSRFSIPQ